MEPLERCALRPIDPAQLIYGPGEFLNKPATWTQSWTQLRLNRGVILY